MKAERKIQLLIDYIDLHGHCNVSATDKDNRVLFSFLSEIPRLDSKNKLGSRLISLLILGGYDFKGMRKTCYKTWAITESKWKIFKDSVAAFKDYYKRFGNYKIPFRWKENITLGHQAAYIRRLYKTNQLPLYKKEMLDEIEFDYDIEKAMFLKIIQKLKLYYEKFGDYNVPWAWPEDPTFSYQINYIKIAGRTGQLATYKKKALDEVGYNFYATTKSEKRSRYFDNLIDEIAEFKKKNGHCYISRKMLKRKKINKAPNSRANK
ncbi:MAG: hypothetical protein HOK80_08725 [Candidatus Cloacimonetes bacterium]|jgi:hypothetical protein|nr:hypothetical protein [Candidatus Cloacimonadota bacterium]